MKTDMNNKSVYLKISTVLFSENSRDERELLAAEKAGWGNIHVIAPKGQKSLYPFYGKRCYTEIDLRPFGSGKLFKPIGKIVALCRYMKVARRAQADIISGHDLLGLLIAYLSTIGLKRQPKLIYDAHEYEMGRFTNNKRRKLKSKLIFFTEKYLLKRAVLTITVNQSIYEQMKADYNLDFPAVIIRNVPILRTPEKKRSAEIRKVWKNKMGLNENDKIYIYHGMIGPGRGIEEAIEAVSSTGYGGLVIMGYCTDNRYKLKLKSQITKSKDPSKIMIHESVTGSELVTYLGAADIGVVLIRPIARSYFFALPNKLFESLHAGNPVIASDLPEIKRVVQSYDVGVLCDSGDMNDIKEKWIFLSKQNLFGAYHDKVEFARQRLNWQAESQILVKKLEAILGEKC